MSSFLRRIQRALLVGLVVWVAIHTVIVWQTGWSSWRWAGFGMYAEAHFDSRAAAIVACDDPSCEEERADAQFFAPLRDFNIPVLAPITSGDAKYRLVSNRPARGGPLNESLVAFRRMATRWHAEGLLRRRLAAPCGPYLVVLYVQHVSMVSRKATVEDRPFVVSLPSRGCDEERRLDEAD